MDIFITANTTWYTFNFRRRLIAALREQGHRITVLAPRDEYVARIEALGVRHLHLEMDNAGTNPLCELVTLSRLSALLRREKPELILSFTPKVNIYVSLAARLSGIPVVANVSGLGTGFMRGSLLKTVMMGLYRLSFRHPHTVFFQNEEDRSEFIRTGLVDSKRTRRLPGSGVDLKWFTPEQHAGPRKHCVFLLVARLLWDKGVREFVEAARQLKSKYPETEFRLLGFLDVQNPSAVSRSDVERWEAEGVITYLGSTDDVRTYYADADCVVLPSYREGTPRTLLEASSMGLPTIATDAVGCRDAVDNGVTGLLCKVRDAADLAAKMALMILMSPEERAEMGMAGRAKMEREFDERIVIERYVAVIREIGSAMGLPRKTGVRVSA
ncbi:glycosyltransferase family 4 protein [Geobacter sp.]|uniref:glycosyltransferase family 4 protein n=1 Tax=Geobacter sp. TaxID=46610 RepID=UPI0026359489|nr:glycosyltransferase family 4 protein [Geobacter sp.]